MIARLTSKSAAQRLTARIRQQLQDHIGRLLDRGLRAVEERLRGCGGGNFSGERFKIEVDRQQHIVELVGDAAGNLGQRLHFLSMTELVVLAAARLRQKWYDPIDLAHHPTPNGDKLRCASREFRSF